MSINHKYMATAVIAQLAVFSASSCFAHKTKLGEEEFIATAPSGIKLRQPKKKETTTPTTYHISHDEVSMWTKYKQNGFRFPEEQLHGYQTLPQYFVAAWQKQPEDSFLSTTEQRLLKKRTNKDEESAILHAEAVARDYILNGVGELRHFLDFAEGPFNTTFDAKQYFNNYWEKYICPELQFVEAPESEDLTVPTIEEMQNWNFTDNKKEIKFWSNIHYWTLGAFDISMPEVNGLGGYNRKALHWYKLPDQINDWSRILTLNPDLVGEMERDIGENAHNVERAQWVYYYIANYGEDNLRYNETVPENFHWEAYWNILTMLDARSSHHNDTLTQDEEPYHLTFVSSEWPAQQDVDTAEGKFLLLERVLEVHEHFAKFADKLGLKLPWIPDSFAPMEYLARESVTQRFKKTVSSTGWDDRKKSAWAIADYFIGLFEHIETDQPAPKGFLLPTEYTSSDNVDLIADISEKHQFDDETYGEAKAVAWAQEALHQAWLEAGEDGDVPDEFKVFEPELPSWYNTDDYLNEDLNPGLRENLEEQVRTEHGSQRIEDALPGEMRLLMEAKAQRNFMEGKGRRTLAPKEFNAAEYYKRNRKTYKEDQAFKEVKGKLSPKNIIELEKHYVERGVIDGASYAHSQAFPPLPEWITLEDVTNYFQYAGDIAPLAVSLSPQAKRALMQQHFFTEGIYDEDLIAMLKPKTTLSKGEYDPSIYELEARKADNDLKQLLDFLRGKSESARMAILRLHHDKIGRSSGIRSNKAHVYSGRSMHTTDHVGKVQPDGSVKVEKGSEEGVVTELGINDLKSGQYKIQLDVESDEAKGEAILEFEITTEEKSSPMFRNALEAAGVKKFSYPGKIKYDSSEGKLIVRVYSRNGKEFAIRKISLTPDQTIEE